MGSQPKEMTEDAGEFGHDDPNSLSPLRCRDIYDFFHAQAVYERITGGPHVIASFCERDYLMVMLVFACFFVSPMKIAQVWRHIDHDFPIEFYDCSKHSVGARMMRAEINLQYFFA
jgi:hypothetical protein